MRMNKGIQKYIAGTLLCLVLLALTGCASSQEAAPITHYFKSPDLLTYSIDGTEYKIGDTLSGLQGYEILLDGIRPEDDRMIEPEESWRFILAIEGETQPLAAIILTNPIELPKSGGFLSFMAPAPTEEAEEAHALALPDCQVTAITSMMDDERIVFPMDIKRGSTEAEVLKAYGTPDQTLDEGARLIYWADTEHKSRVDIYLIDGKVSMLGMQ